jgi:hypothetical protein
MTAADPALSRRWLIRAVASAGHVVGRVLHKRRRHPAGAAAHRRRTRIRGGDGAQHGHREDQADKTAELEPRSSIPAHRSAASTSSTVVDPCMHDPTGAMNTIASLVGMPINRLRFELVVLRPPVRTVPREVASRTIDESPRAFVGVMQVRQPATGPEARGRASLGIARLPRSPVGSPESREESRA